MTNSATPTINATTRAERQKAVRRLRHEGLIPAILYGHGVENVSLAVRASVFEQAYRTAGGSTLIDLRVGDAEAVKVLIQDVDRDPLTDRIRHVDFHQVRMSEKLTADVPLTFVGEAKAVKELGGVLVKNFNTLKIECLPADLVHEIRVDTGRLNAFDDLVRIADLDVPKGITVLEKPEAVVCLVAPPRSEEELKALEEKPEEKVEEVETVKKPQEEEEAAAGEAGPAKAQEPAKAEKGKKG